jgi:SAM-dependent methyltransferase
MMDDPTQATYDMSAAELADFFAGFGPRMDEVKRACDAVQTGSSSLDILELGCGDGRDAADILTRAGSYLGIDYSKELIALARRKHPDHAELFQVADMKEFAVVPGRYDVIFAFASFLHLSREELTDVLERYCRGLRPGGVLCMSFKQSPVYEKRVQSDQFGERVFYFYNPDEVVAMLPQSTEEIDRSTYQKGSTMWFTLYARTAR